MTDDNIYYNIVVDSIQGSNIIPLTFDENRVQPIVDNPSDYELAVERFRLPLTNMPIFLWKPNKFSVKMTYGGSEVNEIVTFIPNGNNIYGDAIWSYQEFATMVNNALDNAYAALKILQPLMPPTEAPFLSFDSSVDLFKWNIEQAYSTTTKVYFNQDLYFLFVSFQNIAVTFGGDRFYQLQCKNNFNNSTTINGKAYFSSYQEFPTLSKWNDLQRILFETDIPINNEILPTQQNVTQTILTDFLPIDSINNRQSLQYYPNGPLRYYDLISTVPMRRMNLRGYWVDKDDKKYPIYLSDTDSFDMKIIFKKRYK